MTAGVLSFRSIPRVIAIFEPNNWIPHFTSVINWTLRLGLSLLQAIRPVKDPWVAIIDTSIDVAVKKALVVLRVPLSALATRGSALTLQDAQCIGVEVAETWNGETVNKALRKIFSVAGFPVAILKDGGGDLCKGVRLLNERLGVGRTIQTIDDVGHVAANAIKAEYSKLKAFKGFLTATSLGAAKLRQSELAFLVPPKLSTKGRFQGITKLAQWATCIMPLLGGQGSVKPHSLAEKLRKFLPGFAIHKPLVERFTRDCLVVDAFLKIMKTDGLKQDTYDKAKAELEKLPSRNRIRKRLSAWLEKHIKIHSSLELGETGMPTSSDIIESLYGKFKLVIARNPKAEFNRIVLAIPTLCGTVDDTMVSKTLSAVSHKDLITWQTKNVKASQSQPRKAFRQGKLRSKMVPIYGEKFWRETG